MTSRFSLNDPLTKVAADLGLGPNECAALDATGARDIGDLLALDPASLSGTLSRTLRRQVLQLQRMLRRATAAPASRRDASGTDESHPRPLDMSKLQVRLSARARRVMRELGVRTLRGFLGLEQSQVLGVRHVGVGTWAEIASLQGEVAALAVREPGVLDEQGDQQGDSPEDQPASVPQTTEATPWCVTERASALSLAQLPLYTRGSERCGPPSGVHESYLIGAPVVALALSPRLHNALREMGLRTVGDLLFTGGGVLLGHADIDEVALESVRKLVRGVLTSRVQDAQREVDYSSFVTLVESFTRIAVARTRDSEIVLARLGLGETKRPTLREMAAEYSITAERVRQLAARGLTKMRARASLLLPFWGVVAAALEESCGAVDLLALFDVLRKHFKWPNQLRARAFVELLGLSQALEVNPEEGIAHYVGLPCLDCQVAMDGLRATLDGLTAETHVLDVAYHISIRCKTGCPCALRSPRACSSALLEHLAESLPAVVVQDEHIYPLELWRLRYGDKLRYVVRAALEAIGEPAHYSEVAERIREENENYTRVSQHQVHVSLSAHDDFRVVGRGTYALATWNVEPRKTHAEAVMDLLKRKGRPMSASEIVRELVPDGYKDANIWAALYSNPHIARLGESMYDLRARPTDRSVATRAQDLVVNLGEDD